VRGVCPLDATVDVLVRAVGIVLQGELWIRRALVAKLVDSLVAKDGDASGATGRFAILTPREIEIARLIGQGASNKRIARHLAITERTVKGHLTAIFRKTGAVDRLTLALLIARRH
jgi:two-component system NarL family response regulator